MAKGPDKSLLNRKVLPVGEWLAENAYIAPGKHRLMTATGLMLGLMAGREVMDVLVGRDRKGNIVDRNEALPPLRSFHGILAYNKYDDSPDQKWMHVADSFIPFLLGAAGAMVGSSQYMRWARHNPVMAGIIKESEKISKGEIHTLQYADAVANQTHARNLNWVAGPNYGGGSVLGNHVVPTPLSQTVGAFRFQLGANKDAITPGMQKAFFGNYGATSKKPFTALKSLISWAENNMAHYGSTQWHRDNGALTRQAKDALKIFKNRFGDKHVEVMEHYLEQRIGQLTHEMERIKAEKGLDFGEELLNALRKDPKFQAEINDAFWGEGLHKQYEKMGLFDPNNPEQVAELIGDNGMLSKIMKWMPGGADVSEAQNAFIKAHKAGGDKEAISASGKLPNLGDFTNGFWKTFGITTSAVGLAGYLGLNTYRSHQFQQKHAKAASSEENQDGIQQVSHQPNITSHEKARLDHLQHKQDSQKGFAGTLNGPVLNTLHWASNMVVIPPGLHRFMNAAFLSGFLLVGAKFSSALTGRNLRGEALAKDQVWSVFKPVYNKLPYVWQSGKTQDRWRFVAHQLIPVTVGAFGTYTGSRLYFQDRIKEMNQAEYLEDYTDKVSMDESESYAQVSAGLSILNTGSGSHALPFANYGFNLQNRFLMGMGQQVATPGLGKWWSANPSYYPWHVKRLLGNMVNYTVENPDQYPMQLELMANALIAKLYPDLAPIELQDKDDLIVDEIYKIRDKYWQPGGIPNDLKKSCKEELESVLRREGLEKTLMKIGLDPMKANIDNNGASGALAKAFGARTEVNRDIRDYHSKLSKRMERYQNEFDHPPQMEPDTKILHPSDNVIANDRIVMAESKQIH